MMMSRLAANYIMATESKIPYCLQWIILLMANLGAGYYLARQFEK